MSTPGRIHPAYDIVICEQSADWMVSAHTEWWSSPLYLSHLLLLTSCAEDLVLVKLLEKDIVAFPSTPDYHLFCLNTCKISVLYKHARVRSWHWPSKKSHKKVPVSVSTDQSNGPRIWPRPTFYKNWRFFSHSKLEEIKYPIFITELCTWEPWLLLQ